MIVCLSLCGVCQSRGLRGRKQVKQFILALLRVAGDARFGERTDILPVVSEDVRLPGTEKRENAKKTN